MPIFGRGYQNVIALNKQDLNPIKCSNNFMVLILMNPFKVI